MQGFNEKEKVEVFNETSSTIFLNNPSLPNGAVKIPPYGRRRISGDALMEFIDVEEGNRTLLGGYLTIKEPKAREFLDIDDEESPLITKETLAKKLNTTSATGIAELEKFMKESNSITRDRMADLARETEINDDRILTLLEKYTSFQRKSEEFSNRETI